MAESIQLRRPIVIALDLEGTLISNAVSQIPRPGLLAFLARCRYLSPRVVIFTAVNESRFREIAALLVRERASPDWFADIEYVTWHGKTKDLSFVADAALDEILLVDDIEAYIHPGQEAQWLRVAPFDYPYDANDKGLEKVLFALEERLACGAGYPDSSFETRRMIRFIEDLCGDQETAAEWLTLSLPELGGSSAEELIAQGQSNVVMDYAESHFIGSTDQ